MDEDKSFEAYFLDESTPDPDPVYYELTASVAEGDGSITWDPTGLSFESGTEITMTATPSNGWKLSYWTLNGEKRYDNPLVFEIKEHTLVEAYFIEEGVEPQPVEEYSFTYRVSGLGEISSSKDPGTYEEGSTITLYATPETDWFFDHWTVNNVEMTSNPLTITLNENTEVIAWFKTSKKFKVTIKAGANGTVKPKYTEEEFLGGDELKITATPDEGYKFDKWKEDGNTEPERTIVITQDTVLTALFADILYYTLRVYIDPTERGTIYFNGKEKSADDEGLCKASFEEGTKVTIEAVANSGWKFVRYEENGKDDVDESEYTITMTKNRTITAVFAKKSQGLDDVEDQNENLSKKVFINGQIYILRGDKLYTIQGQLVK